MYLNCGLTLSVHLSLSLPLSVCLSLFLPLCLCLLLANIYTGNLAPSFPIHCHSELHTPLPQCGLSLPGVEGKKWQVGDVATVTRFYPRPWRPAGGGLQGGGIAANLPKCHQGGDDAEKQSKGLRPGRQASAAGRTSAAEQHSPLSL